MADRFSTPPRRCHALPPASPDTSGACVIVRVVSALSGKDLGGIKVRSSTQLQDVRPKLLAAMGGKIGRHAVTLLDGSGGKYDDPFSCPFADVPGGTQFQALLEETNDMNYFKIRGPSFLETMKD